MNHLCDLGQSAMAVRDVAARQGMGERCKSARPWRLRRRAGTCHTSFARGSPDTHALASCPSHQKYEHRSQFLPSRPEDLLRCGHEHGMALAHYIEQVLDQLVHVICHWPTNIRNVDRQRLVTSVCRKRCDLLLHWAHHMASNSRATVSPDQVGALWHTYVRLTRRNRRHHSIISQACARQGLPANVYPAPAST